MSDKMTMLPIFQMVNKISSKLYAESVIFEFDSRRFIIKVIRHDGLENTEIFDAWAVSAHTLDSIADKIIEEMKRMLP